MPLIIKIPGEQNWDDEKEEFIYGDVETLVLEHSLISISKWEAIWKKPYISDKEEKTNDELYSYIQCMTIKGNCSLDVLYRITTDEYKKVLDYIDDPMTATTVNPIKDAKKGVEQFITSELIYSWMVEYRIPFECQKWHLNRLITLINVLNEQHKEPKKMSRDEQIARQKAINARNKAKYAKKKR